MGYDLKDVKASTLKVMLRDAQRICEDGHEHGLGHGHGDGHGHGHGGKIMHTGGHYKKVKFIKASKKSGRGTAMSLINIEG